MYIKAIVYVQIAVVMSHFDIFTVSTFQHAHDLVYASLHSFTHVECIAETLLQNYSIASHRK